MKKLITKILLLLLFQAQSYAQSYLISNGGSVNSCSGTLFDSGGAGGSYLPDENHTITICSSTPGNEIQVNFTTFDLEEGYDFLNIYDGNSSGSPALALNLSGTSNPGAIISSSGCLTFVFTSDESQQNSGFAAEISCIVPPPPAPEVFVTNVGFYVSGTNGITNGLPPSLNYNSSNPRNYINPGKYVRFKVQCFNNLASGQNIVSGECRIRTNDAGVTLTDSVSGLNNVAYDESAWSTDEFEILIAPSVAPGTTFNFDFVVIDNITNIQYLTSDINFVVAPLWIQNNSQIDDDANPDSQGNNNDIVEPGEVIEFLPILNNPSSFAANAVIGEFYDPNFCSDISVWNDRPGISGNVVNYSYWNYSQNAPQIINAGAQNMVPQFDFVFDYNKGETYKFEMGLDMAGTFEIFQGKLSLVKWYVPWFFNNSYPDAPPCVNNLLNTEANLLSIYPNPTPGKVLLNIESDLLGADYYISDYAGRIIVKETFNTTEQIIDLSNYKSGVYFIRTDKESYTYRIIKE